MACCHLLKEFQRNFWKYFVNLAISEAESFSMGSCRPHRSLHIKLRSKIVKPWTVTHTSSWETENDSLHADSKHECACHPSMCS